MSRTTRNRAKKFKRRTMFGHVPRNIRRYFKYRYRFDFKMPMIMPEFYEQKPIPQEFLPIVISPRAIYIANVSF